MIKLRKRRHNFAYFIKEIGWKQNTRSKNNIENQIESLRENC